MKRLEMKKIFIQYGAKEEFFDKAAVVERLYEIFSQKDEEQLKKDLENGSISISETGNISYDNIEIKESDKQEGITEYIIKDEEGESEIYSIDEYGMDYSWVRNPSAISVTMNLPDGATITRDPEHICLKLDNVDGHYTKELKPDNGDWNISRNSSEFKENREGLISDYPLTKKWFDKFMPRIEEKDEESEVISDNKVESSYIDNEDLLKEVQDSRQALARMTENLKSLNDEKEKLQKQYQEQIKSAESLSEMLDKSLNVLSEIRKSKVGNLFFGRKINRIDAPGNKGDGR